jgi:hypothetical protein
VDDDEDPAVHSSSVALLVSSCARGVLSRGMYRTFRKWMESEDQRWLARLSSVMLIPYLRDTPAKESDDDI